MKMTKAGQKKVGKVMGEYKEGTLHSGKGGKIVKNPKPLPLPLLLAKALNKWVDTKVNNHGRFRRSIWLFPSDEASQTG